MRYEDVFGSSFDSNFGIMRAKLIYFHVHLAQTKNGMVCNKYYLYFLYGTITVRMHVGVVEKSVAEDLTTNFNCH